MVKKHLQAKDLTYVPVNGDTILANCNIGVPNNNNSYCTIVNGSHSETRTTGGNFANFTFDANHPIIMISRQTTTEQMNCFKNHFGQKIFGTPSAGTNPRSTYYILGRFNPDSNPTYLETLDKIDQRTSSQYIPVRKELK